MTTLHHTPEQLKAMLDAGSTMLHADTITEDAIALHEQLRWRSINSAPQDGTEFQGWFVNDNGIGFWEPRCRFNEDGLLQAWGRVDYDIDGWDNTFDLTFSGWMPLPSPPPQENE